MMVPVQNTDSRLENLTTANRALRPMASLVVGASTMADAERTSEWLGKGKSVVGKTGTRKGIAPRLMEGGSQKEKP